MDHSVGKSVRELDCTHAALGLGFDVANSQDNPCLSLTTAEKLRALTGKSSKDAWAFLCPDFTTSIAVTHNQSGVYDLTGGVYLLSNSTRTALEMYAKAEDGESDIVETMQAAPSTGDILPGPLPERATADGVARRGRFWTGCGKFAVAQPGSVVPVGAGCYEVVQLG
jgi:hypothetical protein